MNQNIRMSTCLIAIFIAQYFPQVQKTQFVFDDPIVTIEHEGYLLCGFDRNSTLPLKPVTLTFSSSVSGQV